MSNREFLNAVILVIFNLFSMLPAATAVAAPSGLSQIRQPEVSFEWYLKSLDHRLSTADDNTQSPPQDASPYGMAKPIEQVDWSQISKWDSTTTLTNGFNRMRDFRFLADPDQVEFLRRSSWLYPDDGCFARAELARFNLFSWDYPAPNKIFAFGNLNVKTVNSERGNVSWWYHVAPVVRVDADVFVLDPSVEARRPLSVQEWLALISPEPDALKISVCHSRAYDPASHCFAPKESADRAIRDQKFYLRLERNRQLALQRDPEYVLGEKPPWVSE